jgi:multiple sugar transport system ATP-binding protein
LRLALTNISKSFTKDKVILDDISLTIEDGEFVVFLGPSGCGKTTLLRIIAGLETEDLGDIHFDDVRINELESKDRHIGMVFQNYALYPQMTVFENIAFPLKVNKQKKRDIDVRVKEVAEFIGLSDYLNYKPKQLSGGQRQRVALGRAISRSPKLFLFDEPLSNLDAKLRSQMRTELYNLHRKLNTTSIYVTHDQIEAMTMGDKIVVLNNGKIQQIDTPANIYEKPANLFVATFIGSPQINLINIICKTNQIRFEDLNENISIELKEMNLEESSCNATILGIRPENVALEPIFEESFFLGEFKVNSVEFMGNESIINFEYKDRIISLRTNEKKEIEDNGIYKLYINKEKIILFDKNENKIN